jgi:hypothetical protein
LPNCDDSPSKDVWLAAGWADRPPATEALHDLVFDPHETNNLAGNQRYASALTEMRTRLDRWMRETNDPLLAGPIPLLAGARVNDPNGLSPTEPLRGCG